MQPQPAEEPKHNYLSPFLRAVAEKLHQTNCPNVRALLDQHPEIIGEVCSHAGLILLYYHLREEDYFGLIGIADAAEKPLLLDDTGS